MRIDSRATSATDKGSSVMRKARLTFLVLVALLATGLASQSTVSAATQRRCHPSYKLKCLDPNASDYDCIGGSGNGPKYTGLVKVVGRDVFRLDADHDGWGCERD
jgi:hypothetical protein